MCEYRKVGNRYFPRCRWTLKSRMPQEEPPTEGEFCPWCGTRIFLSGHRLKDVMRDYVR